MQHDTIDRERFKSGSLWDEGTRKYVPTFAAICTKCDRSETLVVKTGRKGVAKMAVEVVAQKFRAKGWKLGARRSKDTCPECVAARAASTLKEEKPM